MTATTRTTIPASIDDSLFCVVLDTYVGPSVTMMHRTRPEPLTRKTRKAAESQGAKMGEQGSWRNVRVITVEAARREGVVLG